MPGARPLYHAPPGKVNPVTRRGETLREARKHGDAGESAEPGQPPGC